MIQNGKNKQQRKHKAGILEDKNLGKQRGNAHMHHLQMTRNGKENIRH